MEEDTVNGGGTYSEWREKTPRNGGINNVNRGRNTVNRWKGIVNGGEEGMKWSNAVHQNIDWN